MEQQSQFLPVSEGFGPLLRRLREERGITAEAFAEHINLSLDVLLRLENGEPGIALSQEVRRAIALVLGNKFGRPRQRLGSVVSRLRLERGLSLTWLSRQTGISVMQLSRIEQLKSSPTEETIRSIATALGVPVAVLFDEEPFLSVISRVELLLSQIQSKVADARQELRRVDENEVPSPNF